MTRELVSDGAATASVTELLPQLVRSRSVPALRTLQVASVLGRRFDVRDLAPVLQLPLVDLMTHLLDAQDDGLLVDCGDGYLAFSNASLRNALYEGLGSGIRGALHLALARVLEREDATSLVAAEHLARGARHGDTVAVRSLHAAGSKASSCDLGAATGLLRRALELSGWNDPVRDEVAASLGWVLALGGRFDDAREVLQEALVSRTAVSSAAPLLAGVAWSHLMCGRVVEGCAAAESAAEQSGEDTGASPRGERALCLATLAWARRGCDDLDGAVAAAKECLSITADAGDGRAQSVALATLAMVAGTRGNLVQASELSGSAEKVGASLPVTLRWPVDLARVSVLMRRDRLHDAEAVVVRGLRECRLTGARGLVPLYVAMHADLHYLLGLWDDASDALDSLAEFAELPVPVSAVVTGALIAVHRGDMRAARAARARLEATDVASVDEVVRVSMAIACVERAEGADERAQAVLATAWERVCQCGAFGDVPSIAVEFVRQSVAVGEHSLAARVTAENATASQAVGTPAARLAASRCEFLVEGSDPGDSFREPGVVYRPLELAGALEDCAAVLVRSGRLEEARSFLEEARTMVTELGASHDEARVKAALRLAGARLGARGVRHVSGAEGWGSLTASERRVAELAAEGLSNQQVARRLFVSPRTVETHLSHVYAKLGVTARSELRRYV